MSDVFDYYPAVLYAINQVSQGRTLTMACSLANISVSTYKRYIANDAQLQEMHEAAEQQSHDAMADALINIDNDPVHGVTDPKMAKVISDNIKWVLARRDAKRFGDRIEVNHHLSADRAITDALTRARGRLGHAIPEEPIEDAQVVEEGE